MLWSSERHDACINIFRNLTDAKIVKKHEMNNFLSKKDYLSLDIFVQIKKNDMRKRTLWCHFRFFSAFRVQKKHSWIIYGKLM